MDPEERTENEEDQQLDDDIVDDEDQQDGDDDDEPETESAPVLFEDSEPESEVEQLKREIQALKARPTQEPVKQHQQIPQLEAKPKIEDFDYDGTKFDESLSKWYEKKSEIDRLKHEAEAETRDQQEQFNKKVESYKEAKTALGLDDFEAAEAVVLASLDLTQQGILLSGAEKPEILVYALGKSRTKIADLSKIKDPIKFAFAVAKMESDLMAKGKKNGNGRPAPERQPPKSTSTGNSGGKLKSDKQLDRLRDEAAKTGDYTKVVEFKRRLKEQARK